MYSNKIFDKFCKERNIKNSTIKGYETAIVKYSEYCKKDIEELIKEAIKDENERIPLKERKLKKRLLNYRSYLLNSDMSTNTIKTYLSRLKTFYIHFEIEIPNLPDAKYKKNYETNYLDLPTRENIRQALDLVNIDMKAIILFMSSSGTAKAETLSLTIQQFIDATKEYHNGVSIRKILKTLEDKDDVIHTFYLKRIKTDKYYYTFCSPEATKYIVKYLKTRQDLKMNNKLFDFKDQTLLNRFQEVNDIMEWGFKGKYRFFRSHTLRKFHASNLGINAEYIDSLQGRSKNKVHEAYIKINPQKLKDVYKSAMSNIIIYEKKKKDEIKKQEFNITINVFLSGTEYNLM